MYINSLDQNINSAKVEKSRAETLSFGLEVGGGRLEGRIKSERPPQRPSRGGNRAPMLGIMENRAAC